MKAEAEDDGTERSGKRLGMIGHVQLNVFDADGVLGANEASDGPGGGQGAWAGFAPPAGGRAGSRGSGATGMARGRFGGWDRDGVAEGGSVDLLPARGGRDERDK